MRWLTNFYDFSFKWTTTAGIRIHPTKAWLPQLVNFKNAIWMWGHFRRMICNKIVLNLEKMPQKRMEYFRLIFDHLACIKHQFLSGIRDSRTAESLWGMMRGVGGVSKSIHQSWLAKRLGLGLGLLCWGFKGVQQEIPSEEASTLQIRSVAFPPGVYTSPQLLVTDYLTKIGIKTVCYPPYSPDLAPCDFWLFPKLRGYHYETIKEMKEAVMKVIDTLTQEDFPEAFQKLLEWYNKCIAAKGDYFEGDESFICVLSIKVPIRKKSGNLFNDPRNLIEPIKSHHICDALSLGHWICWLYCLLKGKSLTLGMTLNGEVLVVEI